MADYPYAHEVHKFADKGLQLRTPVDLVPPNQYSQLTNAVPVIEGRIESRAGTSFIVNVANVTSPGSGLHSLTRLNQPSAASGVSERVAGVDTTVQAFALPTGTTAVLHDNARTGDPLSLPNFHFNASTAAWQIIADRAGMRKYANGLYEELGIAPPNSRPNNQATAVAGGAGNLNNGTGPGYDWLYTFANSVTQSESNPSDVSFGALDYDHIPATRVSPDPSFGGTFAAGAIQGNSSAELRQSVIFSAFPAGGPFQAPVSLFIATSVIRTGTSGCVFGAVYVSLNGGLSWNLLSDNLGFNPTGGGTTITDFLFPLPVTQDPTLIQIRAVTLGVGNTTTPQNVIARRIRDRGGNYDLTGILTGGAGNATISMVISSELMAYSIGKVLAPLALVNQSATVTVTTPFGYSQVDYVRLYRRGGSVTASWAFVGQFAVPNHSGLPFNVTDNIADSNLGSFISFSNDAPVSSIMVMLQPLPYVWGPFDTTSRLFGCGDPNRPDAVYFSNPGNADQWGVGQWVDVSSPSDPMQNGTVFDRQNFAFSKERMYEIVPNVLGTSTYLPLPTPCSRGLISPWGLTTNARAIYFVAKDGIYATSGGPEQSLVENDIKTLWPTYDYPQGRTFNGYDSVDLERIEDIRLKFHNDELYFIYRGVTTGLLKMLVYDQNKGRWRAVTYNAQMTAVYSEEAGPASSLLLGGAGGSMYKTKDGQDDNFAFGIVTPVPIAVAITTGAFDQGMPLNQKEYGNVMFDIDPGGATVGSPVTITPVLNGGLLPQAAIVVTGSGRQIVPLTLGDVFGFNIEFQITFSKTATINPVLYQFDLLWRPEPAQLSHWESRESSLGLAGFFHVRDAYVPLRSNAPVLLTIVLDGVTAQTYTIPSTGGLRLKTYVPFHSNKAKQMQFQLNSSGQFRVYEQDLEVRAKPWLTLLGYALMKPFGSESIMANTALASEVLEK